MEERGQVLPLVALVLVLAGASMWFVGRVAGAAVDRSRARTAADAAALAGAAAGESEARAVAAANGGWLVSFVEEGAEVTVTVEVGDARARDRARLERGVLPGMPPVGQGMAGISAIPTRAVPP